MTDEARDALTAIRNIAADMRDEGYPVTCGYLLTKAADLEAELRRCRVETLREVVNLSVRFALSATAAGAPLTVKLRRMADEAEREANHDA